MFETDNRENLHNFSFDCEDKTSKAPLNGSVSTWIGLVCLTLQLIVVCLENCTGAVEIEY
jgi:hypothetical protein